MAGHLVITTFALSCSRPGSVEPRGRRRTGRRPLCPTRPTNRERTPYRRAYGTSTSVIVRRASRPLARLRSTRWTLATQTRADRRPGRELSRDFAPKRFRVFAHPSREFVAASRRNIIAGDRSSRRTEFKDSIVPSPLTRRQAAPVESGNFRTRFLDRFDRRPPWKSTTSNGHVHVARSSC